MARPAKNGLDYFPLDVDIFEDEKIEAIAGEFGIKGELAVIKLLCAVYKKGYFIVWNDLTKATLLKRLPGVSKELLDQIVARLVAWEFFNEDLFNSAKVLTSENIQAVYFEATKRRKLPKPTKYVINVNNNSQTKDVNVNINTQSKVNKTKINKTKTTSSKDVDHDIGVFEFIQQTWGKPPTGILQGALGSFIQSWGSEMILFAFELAYENGVEMHGLKKYVVTILDSWSQKGIDTLEKAKQDQENFKRQKKTNYAKPKNVRREKLPDWVNNSVKEESTDPEKQAEIARRFEEFQKRKQERQEGK